MATQRRDDAQRRAVAFAKRTTRERLSVLRRLAASRDQERTFLGQALLHVDVESAFIRTGQPEVLNGFANPVQQPSSPVDDFGAPRVGHKHEGIDIFADRGTPVRATVDGVLRDVKDTVIGGKIVYVTSVDGTYYYYAHLDRWAAGIADGQHVMAGEILGFLGRTGDAEETPPHLHFEIHPLGGPAINPYPIVHAIATRNKAVFDQWTVPINVLCAMVAEEERALIPTTTLLPGVAKPAAAKPTANKPAVTRPAVAQPAIAKPAAARPAAARPAPNTTTRTPTTTRPTTTAPPRPSYGKPVLIPSTPVSTTIAPGVCSTKG